MIRLLYFLILFLAIFGFISLWRAYSYEKRKRGKELIRITNRLKEKNKQEALIAQEVSQALSWIQVTEILDDLKSSVGQNKGTQALEDLALEAKEARLIIKKQGEAIRINSLQEFQDLIDSNGYSIEVKNYLNVSDFNNSSQIAEYTPKSTDLSPKQKSYLGFADIISQNHTAVRNELNLYFDSKEEYLNKFYFDLAQRGIEKPEQLSDIVVLIDALARQNKIVCKDFESELYEILELLDKTCNEKLRTIECFKDIYNQAKVSLIEASVLEEKQGQIVFSCLRTNGYSLFGIDEQDDSWVLFIVENTQVNALLELSELTGIKLSLKQEFD